MSYEITDAAYAFLRTLRNADVRDLETAYQRVAQKVNDSSYANALEPLNGIFTAIDAELKRRAYDSRDRD